MKKYGDDADSFHDQGTRVEESKRWHEQHQIRHDYAYRSPSKSNSSYSNKINDSYSYKPKYHNRSTDNKHYTRFNKSNYKPNWSCAPNYDDDYYERNKHRGKNNKQESTVSTSNSNDGWVLGLCCVGIIIIFLIFAIL